MSVGDDATLIKIAVFGITVSVIATMCIALLLPTQGNNYSYEDISRYRNEVAAFSGRSMLNETPWVLEHVYTPWSPSYGVDGHLAGDNWLYGEEITNYSELGKSADIHLTPDQKSNRPLSISDYTYTTVVGRDWWAFADIPNFLGSADIYGEVHKDYWDFTGYRYQFIPTLPFSAGTSAADGALNLVWYSYDGNEGLSGGLEIYGNDVLLASYSASDIIGAYQATSGYANQYNFNFDGVSLNLLIRFNPDSMTAGKSLWQMWTDGDWTLAITTISAGNFYDIANSNSFVNTAGSMINTFIDIYTFNTPSINNPVMDVILWLIVGLPFTIALLCVSLRVIDTVFPF